MKRVLVVDWLGRGGIAQTAEAWARELDDAGAEVRLVTRGGRELDDVSAGVEVVASRPGGLHLLAHRRVVRLAVAQIRSWRPDLVVIQNYVVPLMEEPVHRAAAACGAEVAFVVHDDRHRESGEGAHLGLARQVRVADHVVVHTEAVGRAIAADGAAPVSIPLPVQVGMLDRPGRSPFPDDARPLVLHFGVLHRRYKGTPVVQRMAARRGDRWAFAFAGVGAPQVPGAMSADRFLDPGELVAAVRQAAVVVLPYERATQSAAVVLAQLCRTVPVAAAVGGIPEQIDHGRTGLLVPPGASDEAWAEALDGLADPTVRDGMGRAGQEAVWDQHARFRAGVRRLSGLPVPVP